MNLHPVLNQDEVAGAYEVLHLHGIVLGDGIAGLNVGRIGARAERSRDEQQHHEGKRWEGAAEGFHAGLLWRHRAIMTKAHRMRQ